MKRIYSLIAAIALCLQVGAVKYGAVSSWGYAGEVTGGGNATPTVVKTESELKSALKSSNKVIIIAQTITVENQISTDKSNLTIMAVPGAKLVSKGQSKTVSGIFYLKGSNIILRNITFEGPGAYDCDGKDLLTLNGTKNIWVDHCDFQDGCDGNFDINGLADNISVTWCRFRYLKKPKAGGSGGTDDHRFTNLIGSSVSDKPTDGTYNITYGYCWWDEGCVERMTRCRNSELHFLNCYWNSSVSNYYVCPEYSSAYFEGCTFEGRANTNKKNWKEFKGTEGQNYCKFVNCSGKSLTDAGTVAAPSYTFDHLSAADAKKYVTDACGAGATLTVNEQGLVYSACDYGEDPPDPQPSDPDPVDPDPDPQPGELVDGECCVDLGLGEAPTVSNKGIPSEFGKLVVAVNMSKSSWDPGYLNMGGNADYITFDFSAYGTEIKSVEFDVTIPNWTEEKNTISYHWNNDENTKYTIQSNAKETVQLTAPQGARLFTIQRSASTSTRISKVCFEIGEGSGEEKGLEEIETSDAVQKVLFGGQILILKNGKRINLLGLEQ